MYNKMAINTYVPKMEFEKQTTQTKRTETIIIIARWEEVFGGMGEEVRGLRSTNR